ncbi:hypothetical protein E2562_036228 [Oryza meyeriana var. granulata]|uniref:Uncharacterized protein n=1 Tax=Oryza meyeriana var. granulata TaxID=110450 RepID=A0A6G1ET24_9ORYZ|nr:hypothetical protein E2562_036228 [Oryza meyeriana var. granulata]
MAAVEEGMTAMRGVLKPINAVLTPAEDEALSAERPSKPGGAERQGKVARATGQPRPLRKGETSMKTQKAAGCAAAASAAEVVAAGGKCADAAATGSDGGDGEQKLPLKDLLSPEERKEREAWAASRAKLDDEFEKFQDVVRRDVEKNG